MEDAFASINKLFTPLKQSPSLELFEEMRVEEQASEKEQSECNMEVQKVIEFKEPRKNEKLVGKQAEIKVELLNDKKRAVKTLKRTKMHFWDKKSS